MSYFIKISLKYRILKFINYSPTDSDIFLLTFLYMLIFMYVIAIK